MIFVEYNKILREGNEFAHQKLLFVLTDFVTVRSHAGFWISQVRHFDAIVELECHEPLKQVEQDHRPDLPCVAMGQQVVVEDPFFLKNTQWTWARKSFNISRAPAL